MVEAPCLPREVPLAAIKEYLFLPLGDDRRMRPAGNAGRYCIPNAGCLARSTTSSPRGKISLRRPQGHLLRSPRESRWARSGASFRPALLRAINAFGRTTLVVPARSRGHRSAGRTRTILLSRFETRSEPSSRWLVERQRWTIRKRRGHAPPAAASGAGSRAPGSLPACGN